MNNCFRLWSLGLGLLAAGPVFGAEPLPWPDETAPAESVLKKSSRLIREKTGLPTSSSTPSPITHNPAAEDLAPPADRPEDMLQLEPFIVHGRQVPVLPPALHETPVQEFVRTGALWEKVGRKFKTKFWFASDKGLMLSFSW
jgi:hypothetical protein